METEAEKQPEIAENPNELEKQLTAYEAMGGAFAQGAARVREALLDESEAKAAMKAARKRGRGVLRSLNKVHAQLVQMSGGAPVEAPVAVATITLQKKSTKVVGSKKKGK